MKKQEIFSAVPGTSYVAEGKKKKGGILEDRKEGGKSVRLWAYQSTNRRPRLSKSLANIAKEWLLTGISSGTHLDC